MKQIGIIVLAAVLALGVMGGSLAAWSDTVGISGKVGTAGIMAGIADEGTWEWGWFGNSSEIYKNIRADWYDCMCHNPHNPDSLSALEEDGSPESHVLATEAWSRCDCSCTEECPPVVAHTTSMNEDQIFQDPRPGYNAIVETIKAKPYYRTGTTFSISNGGSIPIHLLGLNTLIQQNDGFKKDDELFRSMYFWKVIKFNGPDDNDGEVIGCGENWDKLNRLLGAPCDGSMPVKCPPAPPCEHEPYQLHSGESLLIDVYWAFGSTCQFKPTRITCQRCCVCGSEPEFCSDRTAYSYYGTLQWEWAVDWKIWDS